MLAVHEHRYGSHVTLINDPLANQFLAEFCLPSTHQPKLNELAKKLAQILVEYAARSVLPRVSTQVTTRMAEQHPEATYTCDVFDRSTSCVVVDLMRAGILPSQICYEFLNSILEPKVVRQDHILLNRQVDQDSHVTGTKMDGFKIGGSVRDALVWIPDPMGATGSTVISAIELYKNRVPKMPPAGGQPKKFVALHFIVTPEYLKAIEPFKASIEIFALRLDRGFSPQSVLKAIPGVYWDQEKGLNENSYIVPGAGGIGEILNNSYV